MRKLSFTIERSIVGGAHDAALLDMGEEPDGGTLVAALLDSIATDVRLTVGGVTMHAAAWRDPEHWASDWASVLDIEYEDAEEAVARLLAEAVSDDA